MRRYWVLALMIVWALVRLAWYVPWLLGIERPSPATFGLVMGVLDIAVFLIVVGFLFRSAVSPSSDDGE